MIDSQLLKILGCPACSHRPDLTLKESELICTVCSRRYPIREGIPILLVEEKNNHHG